MNHYTCLRCEHRWYPRLFDARDRPVRPRVCPRPRGCGSPYWNRPRTLRGHLEAVGEGDEATIAPREETQP